MESSRQITSKGLLAGLEFDKLTHWERYLLNLNLARMEKKLHPEATPASNNVQNEIWRGERRCHHRLDVHELGVQVSIDLSTVRGGVFSDVPLLNLSPLGCCVLLPDNQDLKPGTRIPRLVLPLPEESLILRARVVYVGKCE